MNGERMRLSPQQMEHVHGHLWYRHYISLDGKWKMFDVTISIWPLETLGYVVSFLAVIKGKLESLYKAQAL
jgi:hypothetical protein